MLSDNDIARIAHRIVEECRPLAVGVFGSYAIGTPSERSDLDIFVIMNTADQPFARARAIRRILFGVLHPLDIHVFTPDEFEETAKEELSFAWLIARLHQLRGLSGAKPLKSLGRHIKSRHYMGERSRDFLDVSSHDFRRRLSRQFELQLSKQER